MRSTYVGAERNFAAKNDEFLPKRWMIGMGDVVRLVIRLVCVKA